MQVRFRIAGNLAFQRLYPLFGVCELMNQKGPCLCRYIWIAQSARNSLFRGSRQKRALDGRTPGRGDGEMPVPGDRLRESSL